MTSVAKSKGKDATGGLDDDLRLRSKSRGLLNTSNLPALQNLLKRDPQGYKDDFVAQWNHFQGLRRILNNDLGAGIDIAAASAGSNAALGDLGALGAGIGANGSTMGSNMRLSKDEHSQFLSILNFVTHLAPSYPDITKDFATELSDLLLKHHASLSPEIRLACAKSLVMLCHHDYIRPERYAIESSAFSTALEVSQIVFSIDKTDKSNATLCPKIASDTFASLVVDYLRLLEGVRTKNYPDAAEVRQHQSKKPCVEQASANLALQSHAKGDRGGYNCQ